MNPRNPGQPAAAGQPGEEPHRASYQGVAYQGAAEDRAARQRLLDALVQLRRRRRIWQDQVATGLGGTQSMISDLEKGVTDARLSTLQAYTRAIGARLRVVLDEDPRDRFSCWRDRTLPYPSTVLSQVTVRPTQTDPFLTPVADAGNGDGGNRRPVPPIPADNRTSRPQVQPA